MKLSEIIAENELTVFSPSKQPEVEIAHGYVSDMLSDVIANAGKDCVWMTMQTHSNVIAVAALKDMAGIIIVGGHKPSDETITLAKSKGVCVLGTKHTAFDITGRLFASGLKGETMSP